MDDWGMLSVADVVGGSVDSDDTKSSFSVDDVVSSSEETNIPAFLLDAAAVVDLQQALLSSLRKRLSASSTRIESVFAARFRKLQVSISSSKQIRQRLSESITLMGASLPVSSEQSSLLSTIALLGALTNSSGAGEFTTILLDSLTHVRWDSASPQSCHELFRVVEAHASEEGLSESQRKAVARAKHDLAVRSGRLSLLLCCVLASGSTQPLGPELLIPSAPSRSVSVCAMTTSSFLVKALPLPPQFHLREGLQCFANERTVRFLNGTHAARYETMGTMETRFLLRSTEVLPGERGDAVLFIAGGGVLRIRALGRDEQCWHFSTQLEQDGNETEGAVVGRLALRTSGLSLSDVRFRFCVSTSSRLCCLVSSHPPQRTRGSLCVGELSLTALEAAARSGAAATMELRPLLRNPSLNFGARRSNAFHFTKSVSVSIGRVTLKEGFHPFCIEMWVYPRSVDKDQTFLSIGDKSVDEVLLGLEPVGNGVRWRGGARTPRLGSSFTTFTSPGKLAVLERWWHVALNFDGTTWELWLDHELVSQQPALVSPNAITDAKCVVGKSFIGMAAEVRIWGHTRTGAQLVRDSRRPLEGTEEGLCGYFPFNEGCDNIIMDYAPHHEHALLPFGEPYWCAVDTFPVLADLDNALHVSDFVPLAWIEEADEIFFAASPESYTVAGVRSDHTLCVFDYACDDRRVVSQRTVELPSGWSVKCVSSHASRASLVCCAVAAKPTGAAVDASAAVQVFLWEMWAFVGHREPVPPASYATTWECGRAVLARSARHAQRFLAAVHFLTDQSSWAASVPPFMLDPDDGVLSLLLRLAQRTAVLGPEQDLVLAQQASCLLEMNLLTRFYNSPLRFAHCIAGCYDSVVDFLRTAEKEGSASSVSAAEQRGAGSQLREAITQLAFQPALAAASSSALLRCCCQCFLSESCRIHFLEQQAGKQRSPAMDTVYSCLLALYSSLHACYDVLTSAPADQLSALFSALFREAMYKVEHAFREESEAGLQRTSHCLEVMAEVLLARGGGRGGSSEGEAARQEKLQSAFSTALLHCCGRIIDAVAVALRQNSKPAATLLRCLQLSPVGGLLASFSVSLPLLPTSALEACASSLQRVRESLLVLMDQFHTDEGKRWASRLCVAITYSLAQLGCALLDSRPAALDASSVAGTPAYLGLLRNGQRKSGTERDTLIKNLQGGVGAVTRVFEELQRRDVSALRVVRDEELRETERQVMAACCALLLPTRALQSPSQEKLQPAFQLVLRLRPWVLSKRQESKAYVAAVRERAVFLALFEPIADFDEDDVAAACREPAAAMPPACGRSGTGVPSDPHAARAAERKRWQRLFKSWKAMRQLKALMTSREDSADMNANAELIACFQSETSTEEMRKAVAWRSEKARYRFVGLQLLWELTEEAHRSVLLARVLHPVIARAMCGWHYADGVDGCSVEQMTRLQSAFFHLIRASMKAYTSVKETQPWSLLLCALLSCPFRRADFRKLRTVGVSADLLRRLWDSTDHAEVLYQRVNGGVPAALRATKLTPEGCASTMTIGAAALTLRSTGGRGSCIAPCSWTLPQRRDPGCLYYYEVHVIDVYQGGYVSVGLGPADYSLAQMPGWDPDSFAYDGLEGSIYANRSPRVIGSTFGMGDVVGCGWSTDAGEFFWTRNGKVVHTLKATVAATSLCPLVGMKGKGCVLVNFGASPFAYEGWPAGAAPSRALLSRNRDASRVVRDGWDSFRLLSLRAATTLSAASTQTPKVSLTSLEELAQPVGSCLDALVSVLMPASTVPLAQSPLPARYVTTLLGHLTLLCKLLRYVAKDVVVRHTAALSGLLEAMATRWLLTTSRAVLFTDDESEAVTALLTTWYHAMYLTPPPTPSPDHGCVSAMQSATGPRSFLGVLLQLASCVLTSREARMSASDTRHALEVNAPVCAVTSCDTAHWLALALLQRLVSDQDERGCHAWRTALHDWLHAAFARCCSVATAATGGGKLATGGPDCGALLGLAILGGVPRLAVPGDTVTAILGTHLVASVTLLRTSWAEEVCDVMEQEASPASAASAAAGAANLPPSNDSAARSPPRTLKKLPLRFVNATLQGNGCDGQAFPIKGNQAHLALVNAVVRLAQVWFPLVSPPSRIGEDVCCLLAQLSSLLARCAERSILVIPPELLVPLTAVTALAEEMAADEEQVNLELVLCLWGLLQYRQRRGLPRTALNGGAAGGEPIERLISSPNAGQGLVRVRSAGTPEFAAGSASLRLRTFAALDLLAQQELAGTPADPAMDFEDVDDDDDGSNDEDEDDVNGEEDEEVDEVDEEDGMDEMDRLVAFQQHPRRISVHHGNESDDSDGDAAAAGAGVTGLAGTATQTVARYRSQLSASNSSDALCRPGGRELFDTIHFNSGCVRVRGTTAAGLSFTVDATLRLTDVERPQVLFAQVVRRSVSSPSEVVELVARVVHGAVEFGWLPCLPGEEAHRRLSADTAYLCTFAVTDEDVGTWLHVTFVQSGATLSLFRNGMLLDTQTMQVGGGPLLQEEFRLGGVPGHLSSTAFVGDVRNFRVYELALRPAMVEQLHRLNSSLSTFLDSHVALALRASRGGVENVSKAPAALLLDVVTEGDVGYLDEAADAAARRRRARQSSAPEVDFGTESEEVDLRALNEPLPFQQARLWRRKRNLPREQLLAACCGSYRQLAALHSARVLLHGLSHVVQSPVRLPAPLLQSVVAALQDGACVARLSRLAVSAADEHLPRLFEAVWAGLCGGAVRSLRPNASALWAMGDALLAELLRVAQLSPHLNTFESTHPQRPFATDVYEIDVPGQRSYSVFVDERSVARWRLVTVSRDRAVGAVVSEFYTTVLPSFEVRLPQFYVSIRSAAEATNWGHRITVVHDCQPQLRAMRLFREALSALLHAQGSGGVDPDKSAAYVWSVDCLMALRSVAQRNTSKTRLLALTCLNDLFLFGQRFDAVPPPLAMPLLMQDLRRMAVRHYRRRLPTQRVLGRFIQLSVESYVMQRDAAQCWYAALTPEAQSGVQPQRALSFGGESTSAVVAGSSPLWQTPASAPGTEATATARFARQRQEQVQLYRQRESVADRVSIQKLRNPQSLTHEWTAEGVCVLRSDGAGGSVVAGVPLTAGRWYYELRVGEAGNISVGVLPAPAPSGGEPEAPFPLTSAVLQGREPVAFNGFSSIFQDGADQRRPFGHDVPPLWFSKDYLGIVIDVPAYRCTVLVNGVEAVHFSFGSEAANESAAAAAAASLASPSDFGSFDEWVRPPLRGDGAVSAPRASSPSFSRRASTMPTAYYPYISIEQADSVSLNFGAAYFEYEMPAGCLPLDPANLSLGTVFPYNQMRSLQDMAAHFFSGGRYPLPPFYFEEADPFAGSTERVGPAHVSVHAAASVQANLEEVKNVGLGFETATGDCAVGAGAWYYEVSLRTQGVLQIGWMERGEKLHGSGLGVGDSSTSWAVDLFRRVMWHRGVPEPVNIPRRWTAGDVVGCAIDLAHGELSFFLNGRPITGVLAMKAESPLLETCTFHGVPQGRYYVPAVSLRSGGAISFNFGSSPFKYKPEGFNPLGVPDSWNERMDAFYNNAPASSTMQRLTAMQEVWRVLMRTHHPRDAGTRDQLAAAASSLTSDTAASPLNMDNFETHLLPYRLVVQATDKFSEDGVKAFTKSSEEQLRDHLAAYAYPDVPGMRAGTVAAQSWEMFKALKAVSNVMNALLPFLSLNTAHPSLMTLLFLTVRTLLFCAVRRDLVESVLAVSSLRSEMYRISINRAKAHADPRSVKASVFGQTFALLGSQPARIFQTRQRFWNTVFLGEGAEDAGGPFREHLSEMCRELMSSRLPFFVPTANHVHNTGSHREAFVPAASASSSYDLEAFVFIGRLMGGALRSEDPLDLFLPPLVWRYLCAYPITETEVEQVDSICVQCVREFRKLASSSAAQQQGGEEGEGGAAELFEEVFGEEHFVTQLSDHSSKELIDGGAQVRVTLPRCREYAEALLQARVHEFDTQLRKLREGLLSVVPEVAVLLLTPEELEQRICGQADYKPEDLRKGASYEGVTSEDRRVQLLWKALEAATPLQRRLFLRFVSGRDRMPVKLRVLPLTTQADPDTVLPRAATCFFAVELPDYSSLEVMKRKLFYSIENCADMDTDFNARVVDEDEAPQLSVAVDEMQPDLMGAINSDDE